MHSKQSEFALLLLYGLFYCGITNYPQTYSLKQQIFSMSQFLWFKNLDVI